MRIEMAPNFYFNCLFFKRFFRQLQVIFPRFLSLSVFLFFSLIGILTAEQVAVYFIGLIPSKYYAILGEKDWNGFMKQTIIALCLVLLMAIILATKKFVWTLFYIKSREMLSKLLQKLYTSNINFYKINVLDGDIDNVDQRITQDVDKMCLIFGEIIPTLLLTPFTIIYYTYATWDVTGYIGPLSVYIFFIISTIVNKFLMSPIVSLTADQERQEGEYRYKHMHLRLNSESAAFYRCGAVENSKLEERLEFLLEAQRRLNARQFFLSLSVNSASYFGSILSYIVIAIPIFAGVYDDLPPSEISAMISKASFLILYLIFNFTRLIELAPQVANMAGCSHRIGQLFEAMLRLDKEEGKEELNITINGNNNQSQEDVCHQAVYSLDNVDVGLASKTSRLKLLCKDLSLQITRGTNLLITGESGVGKTSLIRMLDGLWPLHKGKIICSMPRGRHGIFHLPQKPYLTNGTLREQITFPDTDLDSISDEEIFANLKKAHLDELLIRVGSLDNKLDWRWEDILSPGEAQRLAFVRLFCHCPSLAFLDEATSQVSEEVEKELYEHCIDLGMTIISIGHRKSLPKFHHQELKLLPDGDWCLVGLNSTLARVGDGDLPPRYPMLDGWKSGVSDGVFRSGDSSPEVAMMIGDDVKKNLLDHENSRV